MNRAIRAAAGLPPLTRPPRGELAVPACPASRIELESRMAAKWSVLLRFMAGRRTEETPLWLVQCRGGGISPPRQGEPPKLWWAWAGGRLFELERTSAWLSRTSYPRQKSQSQSLQTKPNSRLSASQTAAACAGTGTQVPPSAGSLTRFMERRRLRRRPNDSRPGFRYLRTVRDVYCARRIITCPPSF